MGDISGAPGVSGLPPMPQAGPAPGQQMYGSTAGAPGTSSAHMPPPPLPPVNIPNSDIPFATDVMSPGAAGGSVRRAAPEPNKRALYVGGLDPRVGEDLLRQIFETAGHVQNVKIIPDKNNKGYNYGFVEFDDPGTASRALENLNGRHIHDHEIKVNWAYQNNNMAREDTSNHYHIFVGDLSNDVNDEVLLQAFSTFGVVSEARVMWDMKTGRSRGYGFVAFRDQSDAGRAIAAMDGEWLGSRAIRCNWANQKGQPSISAQNALAAMGIAPAPPFQTHHQFPTDGVQSYDTVASQTPEWQTTVYVGNLTPYTTQNDVVPLFNNFGSVIESRFQADRGFAFIKMDTHANAAMSICQLQGYQVNGRPLKCSWGKDRPPTGQFNAPIGGFPDQYAAQSPVAASPVAAYGSYPQYGPAPMSPQTAGPSRYGIQPATGYAVQSPTGYGIQSPAGRGYAADPYAMPSGYGQPAQYGAQGPQGHQYSPSGSYGQAQGYGGAGRGRGGYGY